jgi:hypothetical protein
MTRYFVIFSLLAIVLSASGCADSLYRDDGLDPSIDRLGVTGRVCTQDPRSAGFPVKVVLLVDNATGPLFAEFDPEQLRQKALRSTLSIHGGNDAFSFAVASYGSQARLLAPEEDYFTRNPGDLENAVSMTALPQGCVSGVCRDFFGGLDLAHSIIDGDMAGLPTGERSRTQYVVVMMAAGRPMPYECANQCCEDINDCDFDNCVRSEACTRTRLRDKVITMREDIEGQGASSFSLHVLHLAASDLPAGEERVAELDKAADFLEEMAFAGAGRFERFNIADTITLDRIGLLKLSAVFEAKSILVTNLNALPNLGEPVIDSDGDGLGDDLERETGTSPTNRDSDGDGIGDLIETLVSMDPTTSDETPSMCIAAEGPPYSDLDGDHLNECEELMIGTSPSLTDTDGDTIPDWVEVSLGTDYLHQDVLDDLDGDGTVNGDEAANHTDPRSSDAASHLASAYRYEVTEQHLVREPSIAPPHRLTGVTILDGGADTSGGLGALRYTPGDPPILTWRDPQDSVPGPAYKITKAGQYQLNSASVEGVSPLERWITVNVDPMLFPPSVTEELLLIEMAERNCLDFTVRNIRLVETTEETGEGGHNDIYLYFAQSPKDRLTMPGVFRVAHVPVIYHANSGRSPSVPLVEISDEEFVAVGY